VKKLRIRLIRSSFGRKPFQRKTIEALGLRHINHVVELDDTPQVRGMINRVSHLVDLEEI